VLNVVVVAPFFGASMGHALSCFAALEGVRLGVISHEPEDRLPPNVRSRVAGHYQVRNALDAAQLVEAGRAFQEEWGAVDRLEGYLEQLQVPLADARDALGIDGLDGESARNFRDKNRMKQVLREAGLPVARQALLTSAADARRFVDEVGFPVVLKPVDGAGARNTVRVSDEPGMYRALNQLMPSPAQPVQAEEFVQGEEHTMEVVCLDGEPVWHSSTFYLPGPLTVLENPWMQYCVLLPREPDLPHVEAFRELNRRALKALGLKNGLSHMEWFLTASGRPVISEVGARPPGVNIMKMNGLACGVDLWAKWTELMVHRRWEMPERRYAAGCAFLRGQGPGRAITEVHGVDEVRAKLGDVLVEGRLPRVGQPRQSTYEGEGWLLVRHPTTQGAIDALRTVVTGIQVVYG
jgi:biotin carboxylase